MNYKALCFIAFLAFGVSLQAQITLDDLSDFEEQAGNWQIVGDVFVNRAIDIHDAEKQVEGKKKKKKRRKKVVEAPKPIWYNSGTGILLNINGEGKNDALITKQEHGDLLLEFEVLLPKGSNSGVYFQGRYELQLMDSWGVKNPLFSDMGGIYKNWEKDLNKMFRGIPPLSNASKAPGLWQKYSIHFKAPRFNSLGEKTANAKFVYVDLNGIRIHSNIELPTYTGEPLEKNEVAKGPLFIQGDHGPVAIRNFNYQPLSDSTVELVDLSYKTYKGRFKGLEELHDSLKVEEGTSKFIDILSIGEENNYGITYEGTLNIEDEDTYTVDIGYTGGIEFSIDDENLMYLNSYSGIGVSSKSIFLNKGEHKFVLKNFKSANWRVPRLGMVLKSNSTNPKILNTYDSYPPVNSVGSIFVDVQEKPKILRAFVSFKDKGKKLSHTIGVGTSSKLNYIFNLATANLVGVWRGDFVDATPMWHRRGNGSFKPRGAVQWLFLNQSIAQLDTLDTLFPNTGLTSDFLSKGYSIDSATKLPVFKHIYKGVEIINKITPDVTDTFITREVSFSKTELTSWYMKLASGKIKKLSNKEYIIGDKEFYINILSNHEGKIREVNGEEELILSLDGSNVKYEIVW